MQSPNREVPIASIGLVFLGTFFLSALISGAFYLTDQMAFGLVIGELVFLIVPYVYLRFIHVDVKSWAKISFNPKYILLGVGIGAMLLVVNFLESSALTALLGPSQAVEQSNELYLSLSSNTPGLIMVAAALILAGICEEFTFRAFIQNGLTRSFQKRIQKHAYVPALLITAVLFGVAHFDPQLIYILSTFTGALILGYVYQRWNYTTTATAHAFMNALVLVLLLLNLG
jgi:membrane protease YdiL (CAAX protease family)